MSRKRKRTQVSPWSLGSRPLSEVKTIENHATTLKQFQAQETERERREVDAKIAPLVVAHQDALRKLRTVQADALFKIPSEEVAAMTSHIPDHVEGSVEEIRTQIRTAFDAARAELTQRGVTLHDSGRNKMQAVSRLNLNVDWRVSANWRELYDLMSGLYVFTTSDVTVPEPVQSSGPEPEPSLDHLLATVSAESTEGRKQLIAAVAEAAITGEFRACWQAFVTSIHENFGHLLTELEKQAVYNTMLRRNMSLSRPADYDAVRVALVQAGTLPKNLVYPAERLSLDLENADLNDRDVRREFARRTHQLADQS
jgi:hypothetical protein